MIQFIETRNLESIMEKNKKTSETEPETYRETVPKAWLYLGSCGSARGVANEDYFKPMIEQAEENWAKEHKENKKD